MPLPTRRTANMYEHEHDRPVYDMQLPFDPNTLIQRARSHGFPPPHAALFAHLALAQVRDIAAQNHGQPVSAMQIAEAMKAHAAAEVKRREQSQSSRVSVWDDMQMELDLHADPVEMLRDMESVVAVEEEDADLEMTLRRFEFTDDARDEFFGGADPYTTHIKDNEEEAEAEAGESAEQGRGEEARRDLVSNICQNIELAVEIGKYLGARDILNLYRANRAFFHAVNSYLMSSVRSWISHHCPDAARVFNFRLYKRHLTLDPAGRTWADQASPSCFSSSSTSSSNTSRCMTPRTVPGLRYLQLVMGRDRYCREIIALMARNGHPLPKTMHATLLRLWLLMELSTSLQREALLRNTTLWTNTHLYNAQLLFIKLGMLFNDPVYGPSSWDLLHLILGQRGLFPLWQLLARKRFKTLPELLELRVRYDLQVPPDHWGEDYFDRSIHGVPFAEVGALHREGWGLGQNHLLRPDELIPMEAVARGLELDAHLLHMMAWGMFDWRTGENYVPSAEEIYIEDEESVLPQPGTDTSHHWNGRHARKKRFATLPEAEQQQILNDEEDMRLRAMAWCGDIDDYMYNSDEEYAEYADSEDAERDRGLDDEIERGFIVYEQQETGLDGKGKGKGKGKGVHVPATHDEEGWAAFVDEALRGAVPEIDEDEKLRMENWNNYQPRELEGDWDWAAWLRQQEQEHSSSGDGSLDESEEGHP